MSPLETILTASPSKPLVSQSTYRLLTEVLADLTFMYGTEKGCEGLSDLWKKVKSPQEPERVSVISQPSIASAGGADNRRASRCHQSIHFSQPTNLFSLLPPNTRRPVPVGALSRSPIAGQSLRTIDMVQPMPLCRTILMIFADFTKRASPPKRVPES